MEKIIKKIVEVEDVVHEFYCDDCNKHLGTSYECDDGWYDELGRFEQKVYVNGWLYFRKCLCDKCKYETINKLRTNLFDFGFVAGY